MGIPDTAVTMNGGCGCGAIRYRLTIPPFADRPIFFKAEPSSGEADVRYPLMAVCHCNDCRRATGAIFSAATMCPAEYAQVFLQKRVGSGQGEERISLPAIEVLKPSPTTAETYLMHYQSPIKEAVMRMFCGRCGTAAGYAYHPPPPHVPFTSLDLWLGTLDREDLERVSVDRHVWWNYGVEWAQRLATSGDGTKADGTPGLPRHPTVHFAEHAFGYANDDKQA